MFREKFGIFVSVTIFLPFFSHSHNAQWQKKPLLPALQDKMVHI